MSRTAYLLAALAIVAGIAGALWWLGMTEAAGVAGTVSVLLAGSAAGEQRAAAVRRESEEAQRIRDADAEAITDSGSSIAAASTSRERRQARLDALRRLE